MSCLASGSSANSTCCACFDCLTLFFLAIDDGFSDFFDESSEEVQDQGQEEVVPEEYGWGSSEAQYGETQYGEAQYGVLCYNLHLHQFLVPPNPQLHYPK